MLDQRGMLSESPRRALAPGRRARQRMRTRARLLDAGRRLIAARGLDAVPIAAITDEADVGVGSFYNYFASKQDLLDVVIAEVAGLLGEMTRQLTGAMDDPAERVAACVRYVVHLAGEDPTWAWFVLRASDAVPRLATGVTAAIEPHLRAGIASGRFTVDDPAVALNVVGGAMLHVMRARLLGRVGPDAARVAAEHVLLMLGIAPAAARAVARRREPAL